MKHFVIALILFVAAGSAGACYTCGLKLNGTSDNGISLNGRTLNGVVLNGARLNDVRFNGISLQGPYSSALAGWQTTDWSAIPLSQVRVRLAGTR
jgi:uncharacterized protein YjbI with pentapeptide repeats